MTAYAVAYQNRLKAQGLCPHCRKPTEINPRTGRNYNYCATERARRAMGIKSKREEIKWLRTLRTASAED